MDHNIKDYKIIEETMTHDKTVFGEFHIPPGILNIIHEEITAKLTRITPVLQSFATQDECNIIKTNNVSNEEDGTFNEIVSSEDGTNLVSDKRNQSEMNAEAKSISLSFKNEKPVERARLILQAKLKSIEVNKNNMNSNNTLLEETPSRPTLSREEIRKQALMKVKKNINKNREVVSKSETLHKMKKLVTFSELIDDDADDDDNNNVNNKQKCPEIDLSDRNLNFDCLDDIRFRSLMTDEVSRLSLLKHPKKTEAIPKSVDENLLRIWNEMKMKRKSIPITLEHQNFFTQDTDNEKIEMVCGHFPMSVCTTR